MVIVRPHWLPISASTDAATSVPSQCDEVIEARTAAYSARDLLGVRSIGRRGFVGLGVAAVVTFVSYYFFLAERSSARLLARPLTHMAEPTADAIASSAASAIDLGTIAAGGHAEAHLRVSNPTDAILRIAEVKTSCPCVSVHLRRREIPPGQEVTVVVCLDLADEPEFTGGLSPELRFLGTGGELLFTRSLTVDVVRRTGFDESQTLQRNVGKEAGA